MTPLFWANVLRKYEVSVCLICILYRHNLPHWGNSAQGSNHAIQAISEDTTLDSGVEHFAIDFEARNIAGSGNVTNGFHGANHVNRQEREYYGPVDGELEGIDPDEGYSRRRVNGRLVKVAGCTSDYASDEESDDDGSGLHDGCAKTLTDDDGDEDTETKTDKLGATPGKRVRSVDVGA